MIPSPTPPTVGPLTRYVFVEKGNAYAQHTYTKHMPTSSCRTPLRASAARTLHPVDGAAADQCGSAHAPKQCRARTCVGQFHVLLQARHTSNRCVQPLDVAPCHTTTSFSSLICLATAMYTFTALVEVNCTHSSSCSSSTTLTITDLVNGFLQLSRQHAIQSHVHDEYRLLLLLFALAPTASTELCHALDEAQIVALSRVAISTLVFQ